MGADIHSFAEVKINDKWQRVMEPLFKTYNEELTTEPFGWRSYGMFGFLADVRNYSKVPCISEAKGLPEDSEWLNSPSKYSYDTNPMNGEIIPYEERTTNKKEIEDNWNYHSKSYLTLKELLDFDYSQTFEDLRVTKTIINQNGGKLIDGAVTANGGEGEVKTFRDFLGESFFQDLFQLKIMGNPEDVRIVFWFDN